MLSNAVLMGVLSLNNCERKGCSMAKKFSDLRARMSPQAQARAEARAQAMRASMPRLPWALRPSALKAGR
jgi:hypothetical protein